VGLNFHLKYLGTAEAPRDETLSTSAEKYKIGRGNANDLRLADREKLISGEHAIIERGADGYYLIDISTNGILLNGSPLTKNSPQYLRRSDELRIGDYQLVVMMADVADVPTQASAIELLDSGSSKTPPVDPLDALRDFPNTADPAEQSSTSGTKDPLDMLPGGASSDPFEALGGTDHQRAHPDPGKESSSSAGSPLQDFIERPTRNDDPGLSPQDASLPDWARELVGGEEHPAEVQDKPAQGQGEDPFSPPAENVPADPEPQPPAFQSPAAEPPPAAAADADIGPAGDASQLAIALARGLNIDARVVADPQTAHTIGVVLRVLLQGLVDMLHARSEFKNSMRLSRTMIQAQDNNPFKVAVNAEDLLDLLLVNPRKGYLGAELAISETISDLGSHELAVLEGLRTIGKQLGVILDPKRLESEFAKQPKFTSGLGLLQKSKYWEAYEAYHRNELMDGDLLTDTFAKVYDEALRQLERKGR